MKRNIQPLCCTSPLQMPNNHRKLVATVLESANIDISIITKVLSVNLGLKYKNTHKGPGTL